MLFIIAVLLRAIMILVLHLIVEHHAFESHGLASKPAVLNIVITWSVIHHFIDTALAFVREENFFDPALRTFDLLGVT